ncbi:MAG: alanine--tRNA ligase [Candidatus Omnitrophica bacterium]|nr:alanine--tRNA ligase [Candidatus Omnitrophota bacterium]
MMTGSEIRKKFLDFFKEKGHKIYQSDLLVPKNDPTLLFTGAGMNQFKEQFMGRNIESRRAATSQKCLRTGDLDNVGRTPRHHTFFEMLGNFSFGDYFKKEAIRWAWEFMTEVMEFPKEKLWVSVYHNDSEAYSIWLNEVGVPAGRIVKLGDKDNFWPAEAPEKGPNGPCGPCSEIFYDWGKERGCDRDGCDPACDCGRYVEVWNLVFTELERKPDGTLIPLPNKNIDTGMGLERITSVAQSARTNFGTDLFIPIIDKIRANFDAGEKVIDPEINLIADHIRAAVFTVCDGVSPSNEKRGYVVRKLIRRAFLKGPSGREPFLYALVPVVTKLYSDVYPELEEKRELISAIIMEEEKRFKATLDGAMPVLESMIRDNGENILKGAQIFKLVDTYGMPAEVIIMIAEKRAIKTDMTGFEDLMEARRDESRRGSDITSDFIFQPDFFRNAPKPILSNELPLKAELAFILKQGKEAATLDEGDKAEVILSPQSSLFYSEGGGQAGDKGAIRKEDATMLVLNTYNADGRKVMEVLVQKGSFNLEDKVTLYPDADNKKRTACNHTATHLLQAALRDVLGDHVKQSGSYVDSQRLRFDFTHMKKIEPRDMASIEGLVNRWIEDERQVSIETKPLDEAKKEGVLSFFGEKYGEIVRVVKVGDISKELCGGDHADSSGDIGFFKIVSESSIASGIRRIEALTDQSAKDWLRKKAKLLMEGYYGAGDSAFLSVLVNDVDGLSDAVKAVKALLEGREEITSRYMAFFEKDIEPVFAKMKEYLSELKKKERKSKEADGFNSVREELDKAISRAPAPGETCFLSGVFFDVESSVLKKGIVYAEQKIGSGVIMLGNNSGGTVTLQCSVTKDLAGSKFSARDILGKVVGFIGGGGGGNDAFAQAGGKNADGLLEAIKEAKRVVTGK